LRVPKWLQALFLNYHLHLAHHRHPAVPWLHLPRYVDGSRPRPRFLAQYARMWLGPQPRPAGAPPSAE
jgi:fatty acid desaturase